jgi:hypothetical protein
MTCCFAVLPTDIKDREKGKIYENKDGKTVKWDGKYIRRWCVEHDRRQGECKECDTSTRHCEHGHHKYICQHCPGAGYCVIHERVLALCLDCPGGGTAYCEHKTEAGNPKIRSHCNICYPNRLCKCGNIASDCRICKGSGICEHETQKRKCEICNPNGYLASLHRRRIINALKRYDSEKECSSLDYLGCTIQEFRQYLQDKFTDGMKWENQGEDGWHIDHIRPCASFNLELESELRMCFHYSNTQPMWGAENLKKGATYCEETFTREWNGEMWVDKT